MIEEMRQRSRQLSSEAAAFGTDIETERQKQLDLQHQIDELTRQLEDSRRREAESKALQESRNLAAKQSRFDEQCEERRTAFCTSLPEHLIRSLRNRVDTCATTSDTFQRIESNESSLNDHATFDSLLLEELAGNLATLRRSITLRVRAYDSANNDRVIEDFDTNKAAAHYNTKTQPGDDSFSPFSTIVEAESSILHLQRNGSCSEKQELNGFVTKPASLSDVPVESQEINGNTGELKHGGDAAESYLLGWMQGRPKTQLVPSKKRVRDLENGSVDSLGSGSSSVKKAKTTPDASKVPRNVECFIDKLRSFYKKGKSVDSQLTCNKCSKEPKDPRLTQCLHLYCMKCLTELRRASGNFNIKVHGRTLCFRKFCGCEIGKPTIVSEAHMRLIHAYHVGINPSSSHESDETEASDTDNDRESTSGDSSEDENEAADQEARAVDGEESGADA